MYSVFSTRNDCPNRFLKGIPIGEYSLPPPRAPVEAPASAGGVTAVFAELNRGTDVTKGLRKVEKSEMTHKNPALRASSTVPSSPSSAKKPTKPAKPQSLSTKKPAKFVLEENKWIIVHIVLLSDNLNRT